MIGYSIAIICLSVAIVLLNIVVIKLQKRFNELEKFVLETSIRQQEININFVELLENVDED